MAEWAGYVDIYRICDWCFLAMPDGGKPTGQMRPLMGGDGRQTPVMLCAACSANPHIPAALDDINEICQDRPQIRSSIR